jgi:hypothetical protein
MAKRFDIRTFAKRVNEMRIAFNAQYSNRRVPIDDTLSRILEHDDTYTPPRSRRSTGTRPPLQNPSIGKVVDIAASMETTVGALLGEPGFELTDADRRELRRIVQRLTHIFRLNDPHL